MVVANACFCGNLWVSSPKVFFKLALFYLPGKPGQTRPRTANQGPDKLDVGRFLNIMSPPGDCGISPFPREKLAFPRRGVPPDAQDDEFRMKLGGLVVVASNAGGAWTVGAVLFTKKRGYERLERRRGEGPHCTGFAAGTRKVAKAMLNKAESARLLHLNQDGCWLRALWTWKVESAPTLWRCSP